MFQSTNPANGKNIRSITFDDAKTLETKLQLAEKAYNIWKGISLVERAALMVEAAQVLEKDVEDYARLMVEEMGKPITAARAEIQKCAWVCRHYGEHAHAYLAPQYVATAARKSYVSHQPTGAVLTIMPWNFPFWQVFRQAAPNITAGNIILLRHSSSVPGCAVAIDDIFLKAGFPEDVLIPLYIDKPQVEQVIAHPIVSGVSLTGSEGAGRSVAQLAGKYLKKSVLELGGSDPFIILADADIKKAAQICAQSRLKNAGQSCIGAKRIIVVEEVYEAFLEAFEAAFTLISWGDPSLEETEMGPMSSEALRDELHQQVEDSIQAGAKCIAGGTIPNREGAWYPPTILVDIPRDCPAATEELFGPVACLFSVANKEAAIALANRTSFGLGAAIFTSDIEKGEKIAREKLEAGNCFVNELVQSDPRLPFGGIKNSGYGRELSAMGMFEFLNTKTVWVA